MLITDLSHTVQILDAEIAAEEERPRGQDVADADYSMLTRMLGTRAAISWSPLLPWRIVSGPLNIFGLVGIRRTVYGRRTPCPGTPVEASSEPLKEPPVGNSPGVSFLHDPGQRVTDARSVDNGRGRRS
jgi:hypothetical protein